MKPLKVDTIDACISENVRKHHTDIYDLMRSNSEQLIIRRGQPFYLRLTLDRDYLPQEDRLSLVFHLTGCQIPGMEAVVPVMERVEDEHDENHSWYASVVSQEDSSVYIKVHASPSCIVGEWELRVDTRLQHDTVISTYRYPGSVIILINPWCPHDKVYIEDDCHKQEYVLSESDIIFSGTEDSTPWFFGQFNQDDLQRGMMQVTDPHPLVQASSHDAVFMIRRPSTAEEEKLLCQYIRDRFKGDVDAVPLTFDKFKNYVLQYENDMGSTLSSTVIICETDALQDDNDLKFSDSMDISTVFISEECTLLDEDNLKFSTLKDGDSSKGTSTMIIPERDLEQCAPQDENCLNIMTPQDRDNMKVSSLQKDDLDVTTLEEKDDFNINAQKDDDDMKITDLQDGNELTVSSLRGESDMEFGPVALTSTNWTDFVKKDVTKLSEAEPNNEVQTMIKDLVTTSMIDSFRIEPLRDLKQTTMIAPRMGVKGALTIQTIDLCISENGAKHRTDRYKQMRAKDNAALIVRRGQPFYLHLTLDRGYSPRDDELSLMFLLAGNKNSFTSSTNIIVLVTQHQKDEHHINGWYASVVRSKGKCVYMKIQASAGCVIGEYTIQLDAKLKGDITGSTYILPQSVFILFNPWCQYDQVYMEDENCINEYVLNDCGVMFSGNYNNVQPMPWFYGQFDQDVLQSALLLFPNFYCDAFSIVRSIITMLSADNGLLKAGGSDDSERGQHGAWTSSVDILAEYSRTRRHCLAMAGTCTTVCRALGIPCRPVTLYNAACGDGLLVDRYFDESYNELFAHDTVRAYHVWNEVWIERADLVPEDDASWNVIDATPGNRRGPASVKAVKRRETLQVYDTKFVHAAVNASVVVWKHLAENKPRKLMNVNMNWVGSLIVTKSLASNRYIDITDNYKFTERCQEENGLVKKCLQALTYCTSYYYMNADFHWVNCELVLPDSTMIGCPIIVKLVVRNFHATNAYNIDVKMTVGIQSNDSGRWCPIKSEEFNLQILPNGTGETLALTATYEDYKQFASQDYFKVTCVTFIPEVDYDYFKEDIVSLSKPKLKIKLQNLNSQEETGSNKFHIVATFTNPLPVQLTNGVFQFEGHDNKETIQLDREVPPYEAATATCQWDVLFPRMYTSIGTFTSNELKDVRGIFQFTNISNNLSRLEL